MEDTSPFLSLSLACLCPYPDTDVSRFQRRIYFDRVSLCSCALWCVCIDERAEWRDSRILKPLECLVLVATGSWALLPTSHLGSSGSSSSFLDTSSSTPSIVVGASVSKLFTRTIMPYSPAPGRPLILPIYLSSPAFNLVSMTSYSHFCFLQHIRNSAFPSVNPSAVLPSAEGSLRDALAETCYFYAQNLPTVVTLLPRAGLALALLISFFSPEHLPGGLTLPDVDQSISSRDGTFFDRSTGALSGYAKGVLIANAAWTAWRTLVLLLSWCDYIGSLYASLFA